ncbi:MAG: nucleotidyl transferase AbiEii/AbiGii toxin family protein [Candidatus Coatesbacteria bacterium]
MAFERLLARLFADPQAPWVLKGGYSLEIRMRTEARGTRDLDLSMPAEGPFDAMGLLAKLRAVAASVPDPYFSFRIEEPSQMLTGNPDGGARYPVTCVLDGRPFSSFHIDVGIGSSGAGTHEQVTGHDFLGFAGIAPARMILITLEQQFAEKIHAYTQKRPGVENSRVRDLVDLVLLIRHGLQPEPAVDALRATFGARASQPLPTTLPKPPEAWREPYREMAAGMAAVPGESEAAFEIVNAFWNTLEFHPRRP